MAAIIGGDAAYNAAALQGLLDGAQGAYRDIVMFNAAAGLIVAERCTALADGVAQAAASIDNGRAKAALEALRQESSRIII